MRKSPDRKSCLAAFAEHVTSVGTSCAFSWNFGSWRAEALSEVLARSWKRSTTRAWGAPWCVCDTQPALFDGGAMCVYVDAVEAARVRQCLEAKRAARQATSCGDCETRKCLLSLLVLSLPSSLYHYYHYYYYYHYNSNYYTTIATTFITTITTIHPGSILLLPYYYYYQWANASCHY